MSADEKIQGTRGIIVVIILAVLVVGYYGYLTSSRNKRAKEKEEAAEQVELMTPVQEVLARNLETNYPSTPREVVKYFSQISQCFYNEEYTEEELTQLALKIRQIYDDELVANQTEEEYMTELKADIDEFKMAKRTIESYAPSSTIDVETFTEDGYEWARLYCIYTVKEDVLKNTTMRFLLREDENEHYKIFGWQLVKPGEEIQTPASE